MDNLALYNEVRKVPQSAQKTIKGGRLSGMTDINPMWRIKTLTEQFGPCGEGWYPEIARTWLENGANGEITANVEIRLYVKFESGWSKPIHGIGGSSLISKEKAGLYTDDEAYKKAYTDAMSVACKMLGVGADVYWEKDTTKYTEPPAGNHQAAKAKPADKKASGAETGVQSAVKPSKEQVQQQVDAELERRKALRTALDRKIKVNGEERRLADLQPETLQKFAEKASDESLRADMIKVAKYKFTLRMKQEALEHPEDVPFPEEA